MRAELVVIGSELLLGQIVDTNAAHIARELAGIGADLYYKTTVGDNFARMEEVIARAMHRSDVVITTGGLGPTEDDLTREVVAKVFGRELLFHRDLMDRIEALFKRANIAMSSNNRKQACIPEGAIVVENPLGTAPGFIVEGDSSTVISIPGVPREMKILMEQKVIPYLRQRFSLGSSVIKSRVLKICGMTEGGVDEEVGDLMRQARNPTVGILASQGEIHLRLTAKAATEAQAGKMLLEMEQQVRERMGSFIYGADEELLEEVVSRMLSERGLRLAVLETNSGGLISHRLTSANCEAFAQGLVCMNDDSRRALLGCSESGYDQLKNDARGLSTELAGAVRDRSRVDLGLAILGCPPGDQGLSEQDRETGKTFIVLASEGGVQSWDYRFVGFSKWDQNRTALIALEMVRRHLFELGGASKLH